MKNFLIGAFALLMTTMSYGAEICLTANGETQPYSPTGWSFVGLSENTTTTPIIAGTRDWKSIGFRANIDYSVKTSAHTMFVSNSDDFADLTFKYAVSIGNSTAVTKAKITVNMQGGNTYVLYDGTLRTGSGSGTFNYSAVKPSTPISIPNAAPWYVRVQLYTTNTLTSSVFYVKIDDINLGCHTDLSGPLSNNITPVANAGADQNVAATSTTLNGSSSYDPGPSGDFITNYLWYQVDGPSTATIASQSSATTSISNLVPGTYIFALTVADTHGAERTDYVNIVVTSPAPVYDNNRTFYNYTGNGVMIGGYSGTQYVGGNSSTQLNVPSNGANFYTSVESMDGTLMYILVARTVNGGSMVWQREISSHVGFDLATVSNGYELYFELMLCPTCPQ